MFSGMTSALRGNADRGRKDRLVGPSPLRTGRANFPHPALRLVVLPPRGWRERADDPFRSGSPACNTDVFSGLRARHRRSLPQWFRPFGTLVPVSPTEASLAALGSGCVPRGHRLHLHLPGPLRSTGVTRLPRYYGSSDSCQASLVAVLHRQVSLFHVLGRPTIPSPTTQPAP